MLEKTSYVVSGHTKTDWVVFTPKGMKLVFKRDTELCKGMPYIDQRTNKAGLVMINPVRKNYDPYAKKGIEKAKLSRNVQSMIGHPSNEHFKQIVSRKDLTNCLIAVDGVKMLKLFLVRIYQA